MFVTVLDVNDNRPIFLQSSYEASVPEDIPEGHSIVQAGGRGASEPLGSQGQACLPHGGRETGEGPATAPEVGQWGKRDPGALFPPGDSRPLVPVA